MTDLELGMIWAQGHGRAIGRDGDIPWHVPEDLALFKRVTMGHPVIMGRTTWESLPTQFRPLPGRPNIVLTSQTSYDAPGATVVNNWDEALAAAERLARSATPPARSATPRAWIMGGASIYESGLDFATGLVVTDIDQAIEGADAFAPQLPDWEIIAAHPDRGWLTSTSGIQYRFTALRRPGSTFGRTATGEDADVLLLRSDLQEADQL